VDETPQAALARTYSLIWPYLDERQRRLLLAAGSRGLGRGGISKIARATGASRQTVHTGLAELEGRVELAGRVRRPGGGHKRRRDLDPGLVPTLEALVDPDTRGDPESPLRWTCKSTRELAEALTAAGHPVSDDTVGRLLREQGYRLQRTRKTLEGAQHPDRDAQFRYLNEQAKAQLTAGEPVVSVGVDHDTSSFAVQTLRALVAADRPGRLPCGDPAAGQRGRGRQQRLPAPAMEDRAWEARGRDWPGDHRVPLPAGHLQDARIAVKRLG
jgi:Rhodopirellula transposase DDE domain